MLRLYNTLTKGVEEFTPGDPSRVTMYTCGPTVYDDAHIGNFRSFLAADLLRRFLQSPMCVVRTESGGTHAGPRAVRHVMNITDVGHMTDDAEGGESGEDRMAVAGRRLLEAKKAGTLPAGVSVDPNDPYAIARYYEARFREDGRRLGLQLALDADRDATVMPRATDHVDGMIKLTARLIERGCAYVVGQPGSRVVYFAVQSFAGYGRLSGNTLDRLRAGEGGRVQAEHQASKRHPADFLLWKEDPRHVMKWPSPWGEGYPGWHIECTVMSARSAAGVADLSDLTLPGSTALIDIHTGGEDNIFPHHECELAQTCCAFNAEPAGATFARQWFHPRFLLVEGAKMSKSKGNFFTPRELMAPPPGGRGVSASALRLELIRTHYRANANFTMQGLTDAQRMVDRWRRVADAGANKGTDAGTDAGTRDHPVVRAFAAAMHEDLNVAAAIAEINAWVGGLTTSPTEADARAMRAIDAVLGVLALDVPAAVATSIGLFVGGAAPSPEVEALLARRAEARAAKDYKASDAIREALAGMGLAIKDAPGGKVEVRPAGR